MIFSFSKKTVIGIDMNTSLAAQGALAHRLQRRTAYNTARLIQNGRRGLEIG